MPFTVGPLNPKGVKRVLHRLGYILEPLKVISAGCLLYAPMDCPTASDNHSHVFLNNDIILLNSALCRFAHRS